MSEKESGRRQPTARAWAASLDDAGLALQLRTLSAGTYLLPTDQRKAVLVEAAERLSAAARDQAR